MESAHYLLPPRWRGMVFQIAAAAAISAVAVFFYYRAYQTPIGLKFLSLLLSALAFTLPVPFLLYGAYALKNASYKIDRDGIYISWGWQNEEIPMNEIEWVGLEEDLGFHLKRPRLHWPGAVVGVRKTARGRVVFFASVARPLVIIKTSEGIYALSPRDRTAFLEAFKLAAEEGSLEPIPHRRQQIGGRIKALWDDRWARIALAFGWLLSIAAILVSNFAASGLIFPNANSLSVGRAVMLSVAALLFQGINLGLGLFAYQSPERRPTAYFIWIIGVLSASGFLLSEILTLQGTLG